MTVKFSVTQPAECLQAAQDDVKTRSSNVALTGMFIQEWDTPALGFLGVAAAKIVHAYTTVFTELEQDKFKSYVYFDGRFAYAVNSPNEAFSKDVVEQNVKSFLYASDYETQIESEEQSEDTPPEVA
jgi:hypothetical protein